MYYLELFYYKTYCFEKLIGQLPGKSLKMWLAPLSVGLIMLRTLLLLTKEELSFIIFLIVIFLPIFFYQMLLRGKHDAIIEKFDKEPEDKKKRDNLLVIGFYVIAFTYFFSILFATPPVRLRFKHSISKAFYLQISDLRVSAVARKTKTSIPKLPFLVGGSLGFSFLLLACLFGRGLSLLPC